MKRILVLIILVLALSSCTEQVRYYHQNDQLNESQELLLTQTDSSLFQQALIVDNIVIVAPTKAKGSTAIVVTNYNPVYSGVLAFLIGFIFGGLICLLIVKTS